MGILGKIFSVNITKDGVPLNFNPLELLTPEELKKGIAWQKRDFHECVDREDWNAAAVVGARLRVLDESWYPDIEASQKIKHYMEGELAKDIDEGIETGYFGAAIKIIPLRLLYPDWRPNATVTAAMRPLLEQEVKDGYTRILLAPTDSDRLVSMAGLRLIALGTALLYDDWRPDAKVSREIFAHDKKLIERSRTQVKLGNEDLLSEMAHRVAELRVLFKKKI